MAKYDHYANRPAGYPGGASSSPAPAINQTHYDAETAGATGDGVHVGTASTKVRLGFLRKVYTILTLNFAITVAFACAFSFIPPIRDFVYARQYIVFIGLILGVGTYLALACIKVGRPWNLVLFTVFVFGFSIMIGTICASYYKTGWGIIVLQAFAATLATFVTITAYIFITKKDFSYLGGAILGGFVILIVLALISFVTPAFGNGRVSRGLSFGVSVIGAILMMLLLLYNTSIIVNKFGPDDWLIAVISLYTNVISIFLYMLSIFSFIQT